MRLLRDIASRSSRVFFTLLVSYLVILAIPLLIGSVAYIRAARVIAADVSEAELALLKEARNDLERGFAHIRRMSWQISINSRVRGFLEADEPFSPDEHLAVPSLIRELQPHLAGNPLLLDFYIFFRNSGRLVTPTAIYDPSLAFKYLYALGDISSGEWEAYLRSFDEYMTVLSTRDLNSIDRSSEAIVVVQSLPMDEPRDSTAVLVALLDSRRIRQTLAAVSRGGYAAVLDSDGAVLLDTGPEALPPVASLPGEERHGIVFERRQVTTFARSEGYEFTIFSVVPRGVFLAKLRGVRNLMFVIAAICVLVGLAMAYLMAHRNYLPIRGVAETLAQAFGRKPAGRINELEFIRETVLAAFHRNRQLEARYENIIRENRRFREQINRNSDLVKNGLLARLISGRVQDYERALDWLGHYEVRFLYDRWQVVLVHIEDGKDLLSGEGEWSLVRFIVGSLAEEMAGRRLNGHVCELDFDLLALIVNSPGSRPVSEINTEIAAVARRVQEFMQTHYQTELTVGIGSPADTIEGLPQSTERARDALNYRIIREKSAVILYDEITDRVKDYHYPIESELRIINSVRAGDYPACETILDETYHANMHGRQLSPKLAQCLVFDMIGTAMRVLDQTRINYVDIFGEGFDPVGELMAGESVPDTYRRTKRIYREICRYLNGIRNDRHFVLRERILTYIQEHYLEESLSQTRIAEDLGITAPYLSTVFKQETGTSMVDYINRLRVDQAKVLLARGTGSLSEIAAKVGCGSDKTLIRLFKRFEGVTPGRFRDRSHVASAFQRNA